VSNSKLAAVSQPPVHKGVINDAGVSFFRHTEFFAEFLDRTPLVVMMLACLAYGLGLGDHTSAAAAVADAIDSACGLKQVIAQSCNQNHFAE